MDSCSNAHFQRLNHKQTHILLRMTLGLCPRRNRTTEPNPTQKSGQVLLLRHSSTGFPLVVMTKNHGCRNIWFLRSRLLDRLVLSQSCIKRLRLNLTYIYCYLGLWMAQILFTPRCRNNIFWWLVTLSLIEIEYD